MEAVAVSARIPNQRERKLTPAVAKPMEPSVMPPMAKCQSPYHAEEWPAYKPQPDRNGEKQEIRRGC
jgi:hypothetical protein